jgi:hypothetical protein
MANPSVPIVQLKLILIGYWFSSVANFVTLWCGRSACMSMMPIHAHRRSYHLLASGSSDRTIRLWKIVDAQDGTYVSDDAVQRCAMRGNDIMIAFRSPHRRCCWLQAIVLIILFRVAR